ncbi:hypothetical protein BDD21_0013 [Thiocapsa rosea]|uniref:Uncharacterized protein n=1 Tax=Thiocapsa rosea TaxID=69360 RepID=A0A495V011_9GAMM|nr:hypothetical protein BDD21_0013 [Thiocapsa rosea]
MERGEHFHNRRSRHLARPEQLAYAGAYVFALPVGSISYAP